MVNFSGKLGNVDLPSLIKFLSDLNQTGTLELRHHGWSAQLGIRGGDVVAASFGHERGLAAIMALSLVMREANFDYLEGHAPAEDELDLTLDQLHDHLRPSTRRPPLSLDAVPSRTDEESEDSTDDDDQEVVLKRAALRNLLAVDGRRTVREIIGDAPLAATLRNLADLIDSGLITVDAESGRNGTFHVNGAGSWRDAPDGRDAAFPGLPPAPPQRANGKHQDVEPVPPPTRPPTNGKDHGSTWADAEDTPLRSAEHWAKFDTPPQTEVLSDLVPLAACPKLGFADDPASHFARPTALHRCFASGSLKPVSTLEQRDLCLGGGWEGCPRLRQALGLRADEPVPSALRRLTVNRTLSLGPGKPPTTEAPTVPSEWQVSTATEARHRANGHSSPGTAADKEPEPKPATNRGVPLLPIVAISLAIAAVLAWAYVLVLRPQIAQPPAAPETAVATEARANSSLSQASSTNQQAAATVAPTSAPAALQTQPQAQPTPAPARPTAAPAQPTPIAAQAPNQSSASSQPAAQAPSQSSAPSQPAKPGATLIDTNFANSTGHWRVNPPFATWASGALRVSSQTPGRFAALGAPVDRPVSDVSLSATFHKTGGPPGGGYGLIIRDQEIAQRDASNQSGHFYVFEVSDRGDIGAWRRNGDQWVDLLSWTHSDAVHTGTATNDLAVQAVGSNLSFMVNGTQVATLNDGNLEAGGVGVFVGGDLNEVAIDRFTAQALSN